jgi:hypothetical protein
MPVAAASRSDCLVFISPPNAPQWRWNDGEGQRRLNQAPSGRFRYVLGVPGAVIIVIAMVLVLPVAVMLAGAVWSAVVGWAFDKGDRGEDMPAEGETDSK